jgi:hypothetical protein
VRRRKRAYDLLFALIEDHIFRVAVLRQLFDPLLGGRQIVNRFNPNQRGSVFLEYVVQGQLHEFVPLGKKFSEPGAGLIRLWQVC